MSVLQRLDRSFKNARALHLFQRVGVSPLKGGIALCAGWIFLVVFVELLFGRLHVDRFRDPTSGFSIEFTMALMLGVLTFYIFAAIAGHEERTRKTVAALRGMEELSGSDIDETVAHLGRYPLWRFLLVAISGFVIALLAPLAEFPIVGNYEAFNPLLWSPEVFVHRIVGPFLGAGLFLLLHAIVADSVRFWLLARKLRMIELSHIGRYAPFTEQGLSNAVIILGFVSMFTFLAFADRYLFLVGSVILYGGVAALLGLFLPVLGLHGRIRDARNAEADWFRKQIPAARMRVKRGAPGAVHELAGLLACLRDTENVSAWPIAQGGLTRFGLFLLIPLGSWAGGALVERLIDSALS